MCRSCRPPGSAEAGRQAFALSSLLFTAMAPPQAKDEVRHSASPDIESLVYNDEHEVRVDWNAPAAAVSPHIIAAVAAAHESNARES